MNATIIQVELLLFLYNIIIITQEYNIVINQRNQIESGILMFSLVFDTYVHTSTSFRERQGAFLTWRHGKYVDLYKDISIIQIKARKCT